MDAPRRAASLAAFRPSWRQIAALGAAAVGLTFAGCEVGARARPDAGRWIAADGAPADAARADAASGDRIAADGAASDATPSSCDAAGCRSVVMAAGQNQPCGLALDAESIYWTVASGDVRKMPLAGGAITTLASGQDNPCSIVVDGANVYWLNAATAGAVMTVPASGGTPSKLADSTGRPWKLAIRGGVIYWTNQTAGTVSNMPTTGGARTVLAENQAAPVAIDVDATALIWSSVGQSAIRALTLAPLGTVATLAEDQEAASNLRLEHGVAYWTNDETGEVRRAALAGGGVVTLATSTGSYGLALDDRDVYFTEDGAGRIWRVPQAGGAAALLADDQQLPSEIAVDGQNIYWLNSVADGAVMKRAK